MSQQNYPDLIDVRSFAAWCLVHDIEGTKDGGGCNLYFMKYDTTAQSKIVMPLTWDFDMSERTISEWSRSHTEHMKVLFNNTSNRAFIGEFAALWREIRGTLVNDMKEYMLAFRKSDEGAALSKSFALDKMVYNRYLSVLSNTISRYTWIQERIPWLDNAITALNPLGDVNVDSRIDITDVTLLIQSLMNEDAGPMYAADVNEDGSVNITDVTQLVSMILEL